MTKEIGPIEDLIKRLNRLPGIGSKTAQRLAYYIIGLDETEVRDLAEALISAKNNTVECSICMNYADSDPCEICSNKNRDDSVICVVESPKDVDAMERSLSFRGKYHVLHGVISPLKGKTPEDVTIKELIKRIEEGDIKEVIVATNPTVDGDATARYIKNILEDYDIIVSRIGYGLPVGGDLEYYDEITIQTAMENRRRLD
ncbi:recombination protein RecR [Peptoniphilus harei ACS-146-V-Sch2b]|uniref:Recombination protein RecR n=1 Tax=Peptoniphilus harei ACS-146-V-Sch2b TaxID=908338 RepID=E4L069_9FIRM|nr:recombination mediator RecR [Peptoniphilus harei]EFR32536.1 recombination protein RecR [Peptoniphilus harei ACS-146-V-Sch2b]MDK7376672.1 recombination mediator RecR [Peptoniphilus harei]MDK7679290.1 recombination mediator RecR [Peptoniphilus harei]MDU3456444.1 recombination mediator RecR [Peptoniphilus harei]MDU5184809.1 recombination mediator RecR [Peptoniphilus harei]